MGKLSEELDALGAAASLPISRRKALMGAAMLVEGLAFSLGGMAQAGATGGLKVRRMVIDGDLAVPAGNITVGPVAPTKGNVIIDGAGIRLRNYTTNKINLTTGGDVMIGSDLSQPGFTYLSIFSIQQNYNSENFLAGDMLIGDNSAAKANIKWDKANGQLKFRGGTTTQVYIDTDGSMKFGAGAVSLNINGIQIGPGGFVNFYDSTALTNVVATVTDSHTDLVFSSVGNAAFPSATNSLQATTLDTTQSLILVLKTVQGTNSYGYLNASVGTLGGLIIGATTTPNTMLDVRGSATATGGLNVGSATGAATGSIKASLDGTFAGGLNVGSATGAVTGEILTSLTGTWTPAFTGTGTAGVFTYTNQVGFYVKIGGLVFIQGRVTISAIGTPPTTSMTITGLPFTSKATANHIGGIFFTNISHFKYSAAALALTGLVGVGGTGILLRESFTNAATVAVPAANFTDVACDLIFSGFYEY